MTDAERREYRAALANMQRLIELLDPLTIARILDAGDAVRHVEQRVTVLEAHAHGGCKPELTAVTQAVLARQAQENRK